MKHASSLHNLTYGRNLYVDNPTTVLRAEAERLTANRAVIAADLASWDHGENCLTYLDVVLNDCLGAMLSRPTLIVGMTA